MARKIHVSNVELQAMIWAWLHEDGPVLDQFLAEFGSERTETLAEAKRAHLARLMEEVGDDGVVCLRAVGHA